MFDPSNALKKMLGPRTNVPKFGNPTKFDWDGDGVTNKRDCQPRNPTRQDSTGWKRLNKNSRDYSVYEGGTNGEVWLYNNGEKIVRIIFDGNTYSVDSSVGLYIKNKGFEYGHPNHETHNIKNKSEALIIAKGLMR